MTKQINVAILGATGAVGETMLQILAEREFPVAKLYPLASQRSRGLTVTYKNKVIDVIDAESFDFKQADLCMFSAGGEVSKQFVTKALEAGCTVIDNTAAYRYDDDIPLIIPEINLEELNNYDNPKLIANPNCSTIQMLVALYPIYQAVGIKRINIATYQSVSGSGKSAISELVNQLTALLNGRSAYTKAVKNNEVELKELLVETKRNQLRILKMAYNLEDKNPDIATLEVGGSLSHFFITPSGNVFFS